MTRVRRGRELIGELTGELTGEVARLSEELSRAGLLSPRFHVVTGKGGVGKSTVSVSLGLSLARAGKRVLICEVDEREQLSHAFGVPPSGGELIELHREEDKAQGQGRSNRGALWGVNIKLDSAVSEYGLLKLKVRALSQLLTDNPLTRALISVIPGVGDLVYFGKAFNHEREREGGRPVWDAVILDAPATGHSLTFLSLPKLIAELVPVGNIKREADEMWALVSDPHRCALHVVATPEELPIQEARELCEQLRAQLSLTPTALWLNRARQLPSLSALTLTSALPSSLSLGAQEVLESLERARREVTHGTAQLEELARELHRPLLSLPTLTPSASSAPPETQTRAQTQLTTLTELTERQRSSSPLINQREERQTTKQEETQLIALVGSGGVGKTTVSAGLALALAEAGARVALITIDPAKRLAQALGLSELCGVLEPVSVHPRLWAMSLERGVSAARLVTRYAPNAEVAERLNEHPYFKAFSGALPGAQEYMAIYEVSEALRSGRFDVVVLDTPPGRHALDFLDAPRRLARAASSPALSLFAQGSQEASSAQSGQSAQSAKSAQGGFAARVGKGLMLKAFGALTSSAFLSDLTGFLTLFLEILRGLERDGEGLIKVSERAEFWLVSTLEEEPLRVAELARLGLVERQLTPTRLTLNRLPRSCAEGGEALLQELAARAEEASEEGQNQEAEALSAALETLKQERAQVNSALDVLLTSAQGLSALPLSALGEAPSVSSLERVRWVAEALKGNLDRFTATTPCDTQQGDA